MEVPKEEIFDLNIFGKWEKYGNSIVENKSYRIVFDKTKSFLQNMTLFDKNTKLLITDNRKKNSKYGLHLCDLNGNRIKSFNPGDNLTSPGAICVLTFSNQEEIFIANKEELFNPNKKESNNFICKIIVFRSNFEVKFEFVYSRTSPKLNLHDLVQEVLNKPHTPACMQIDNEFNNTRLYISDHIANKISIFKTSNGEQIDAITILRPDRMIFSQDHIYVASITPANCSFSNIYKIRKQTLEIEKVILNREFFTTTHLLGLDPLNNIIMLAKDLIELNTNQKLQNYYLAIDENGKTITKYLTDLKDISYSLALKNKIFTIDQNVLRELEFRKW